MANGDLMYQFYSDKFIPAVDSTSTLGTSAARFKDLSLSGTAYAATLSSTLVSTSSVSAINLAVTSTSAAATLTTGTPTFTAFYGSTQTALAEPTSWLAIVVGGTSYKIPLY